MSDNEAVLADRLARRIGWLWEKHEATGDDAWLAAIADTERLYRRLKSWGDQ